MARRTTRPANLYRMDAIARTFAKVPDDYRPAPFWFWNGDPTDPAEVVRQLESFKRIGVRDLIPFALYGLDISYAEEPWYDFFRFVTERCARLGLRVWIYDEYHCPSGTCAGKVLRDHPEYRRVALVCHTREVRAGGRTTLHLTPSNDIYATASEDSLPADGIVQVYAEDRGGVREVGDYTLDHEKGDILFRWKNPMRQRVRLHLFVRLHGKGTQASSFGAKWAIHQGGHLDVLNPDAVRAFLHRTFDGYERHVEKYFGSVIPGVFTDEPGITYGVRTGGGMDLPYTEGLYEQFQTRYGYDLSEHLAELAIDTGDFRRVRRDYRRLLTELFSRHYNRQYSEWCAARGMVYTGHYLGEELLAPCANVNGDAYEAGKWMHMPGIDILRTEIPYDPAPTDPPHLAERHVARLVTAKQLVSTAHATGAKRVLCEAFGIPPYGVTLQDLKKMTDWLCANGVNFINDNGFPYSVKGMRLMAGRSWSAPWMEDYSRFAAYVARLSHIATCGRSAAEIALLYPTTATHSNMSKDVGRSISGERESTAPKTVRDHYAMQRTLIEASTELAHLHREFDYLYEEPLLKARIRQGALEVGEYRYRVVVLPAVTALEVEVLDKLQAFVRAGGHLVLVGTPPRHAVSDKPTRRIPASVWGSPNMKRIRSAEGEQGRRSLQRALQAILPAPVRLSGDHPELVQSALRVCEDGWLLFLANHAQDPSDLVLHADLPGDWEVWDLDTGDRHPMQTGRRKAEARIPLHLRSQESALFAIRKPQRASRRTAAQLPPAIGKPDARRQLPVRGAWTFRLGGDNLYLFDQSVAYDLDGKGLDKGWHKDGDAPWERLRKGRGRLSLDPDLMRYYWVSAEVTLNAIPKRLRVFFDGENACRLFVNGREAKRPRRTVLWDPENVAFNVRHLVRKGRNRFVMRVEPSPYHRREVIGGSRRFLLCDVPQVMVLAGPFKVQERDTLVELPRPDELRVGSWHRQGYPHYAGEATYRNEVELPALPGRTWLVIDRARDVAEIRVNGRDAGTRAWEPYRVEVTDLVRKGRNRIEITFRNTWGNVIKRRYNRMTLDTYQAGLLGPCRFETESGS